MSPVGKSLTYTILLLTILSCADLVITEELCEESESWKCANGHCIPYSFYCDGEHDCVDGSDETPGCVNKQCEGSFECESGECISIEKKCNGKADCRDGSSDEKGCLGSQECRRDEGQFQCKSGETCIDGAKVCDKTADCPDQSDEFIDCDKSCKNSTCSHGCLPDPDSKQPGFCFCFPGYRQSNRVEDNCVDIDECNEYGRCSQTCVNLVGSFQCSCISGFKLAPDNSSCHLVEDSGTLVFALHSGVRGLPLGKHENSYFLQESVGSPVSVGYNAREDYVYWTDAKHNEEAIWRSRLNGTEIEVVVNTGLVLPEGIAYDWIGNNIYFTDSNKSHIVVCSGDEELCSILIQEKMDKPRDIALHPNQGLMFWTDWGTQPGVVRAGMDGSLPIAIIRDDILWPNGIAVDHGNSRIYWTDASTDRIESARYDGSDRRIVHSGGIKHPFGVDVMGDLVFWSDWNMYEIQASNKFNGSNRATLVKEPFEQLNGLAVVHKANQPITRRNDCKDAGCSHICTLGPENSFRCMCPVGMNLDNSNKKICLDSNRPKLLLGYNNTLKTMRFNSIGRNVFEEHILENVGDLGSMVYNPVNDSVILSDIKSKKIYEFELATRKLNVLVDDGLESVKGMDIDIVGENLYWVDSEKRTVEVLSLRSQARVVLLKELDRPMDIIIIPDKQIVIIAQTKDSGGGSIVKMSMNGSNRQVLMNSIMDFQPVSLAFHRKLEQIFWIDRSTTTISSMTLDGRITNDTFDPYVTSNDITSYEDKIYWTHKNHELLQSMNTDSNIKDRPIYFGKYTRPFKGLNSYQRSDYSTNVAVIHKDDLRIVGDLVNKHECSPKSDKEPCSHICLISGKQFEGTCVCPVGLVLDKNLKNCACPESLMFDKINRTCVPVQIITIKPLIVAANTTAASGDEASHGMSSDDHILSVTVGLILSILTLVVVGSVFVIKRYKQHIRRHKLYKTFFVNNFVPVEEL